MYTEEEKELWLGAASERVRRNADVITPVDIDQDYLLHISSNPNIRRFIPTISPRQGNKEDRTMARICVCPTLWGCFIGYAKADYDFNYGTATGTKEDGGWRGGWKIYALPFEAALKPNNRLVYDSVATDEIWLTTYNDTTREYIPEAAGKCFYRYVTLTGRSGNEPRGEFNMFVEITRPGGVRFSMNHYLAQGYWEIEGPVHKQTRNWKDDKEFTFKSIDRETYVKAKDQHASLLGFTEPSPAHQRW